MIGNSAGIPASDAAQQYLQRKQQKRSGIWVKTCCCGCTLGQGTVGAGIESTVESIIFLIIGILVLVLKDEQAYSPKEAKQLQYIGITFTVQGAVVLACSISLFFAVSMKRRDLLMPWLIVKGIILAFNIIAPVIMLVMGFRMRAMGASLVWTVFMVYLYVVVFSYYQSDMGRLLTQGIILVPPPPPGYGQMNCNGAPTNYPPGDPSAYPCPMPAVPFYPPPQQGGPTNMVQLYPPLNDTSQTPGTPGEQPPPYSPNFTNMQPRQPSPKRF